MASQTTILLADDDPEDQEILKEMLLREDPDLIIDCVMNGQLAVSYLDQRSQKDLPALIILDYKMPGMNGVETLESLKGNARYAGIPKVVWSTSDQVEHRKLCLDNGAIRYFVKPGSPKELTKLAKTLLELISLKSVAG